MKIATLHTEGEGVAAGVDVEEWLLLDRVALDGGDVAEGHAELAALVEADLADAAAVVADQAARRTNRNRSALMLMRDAPREHFERLELEDREARDRAG